MNTLWVSLASLVIGLLVRVLKGDLVGPTIPARARPWAAVGLGLASGVLEQKMTGIGWQAAITGGLVSAGAAIASHDAIIEGLRKGKELPTPKFMKKKAAPVPESKL